MSGIPTDLETAGLGTESGKLHLQSSQETLVGRRGRFPTAREFSLSLSLPLSLSPPPPPVSLPLPRLGEKGPVRPRDLEQPKGFVSWSLISFQD